MNKDRKPQKQNQGELKPENLGKFLDKFKVKLTDKEFMVELYNPEPLNKDSNKYSVLVNGNQYSVEIESIADDQNKPPMALTKPAPIAKPVGALATPAPMTTTNATTKTAIPAQAPERLDTLTSTTMEGKTLSAPMPGKILEIKVDLNEEVEAGQPLVILEAMKMENVMTAPASGIVKDIPIKVGINVNQGDILVVIE